MKKKPKLAGIIAMTVLFALAITACEQPNDTSHTCEWAPWLVTTAPTETKDGEETRICIICGETETRPIPRLNHVHRWGEWAVTTAPTETENGEETRVCAGCDDTETRPIPSLNHVHQWGEWAVTTPPTETEDG